MITFLKLIVTVAFVMPPEQSTYIAAWCYDAPVEPLLKIMKRESRGKRLGIHKRDAHKSRLVCKKAKKAGWISKTANRCRNGGYSTRGAHGLMAGYNLRRIGMDRWPWLLDIPILSAFAAADRFIDLCPSTRWRWCPGRSVKSKKS